jgi:hypothetical protein
LFGHGLGGAGVASKAPSTRRKGAFIGVDGTPGDKEPASDRFMCFPFYLMPQLHDSVAAVGKGSLAPGLERAAGGAVGGRRMGEMEQSLSPRAGG